MSWKTRLSFRLGFRWISVMVFLLIGFALSSSPAQAITTVAATSSTTGATQPSTMKNNVLTSDGTLHMFIQMGTDTTKCASGGLWWLYSTDSGSNWTCGGQLSSDTANLYSASTAIDSSDNIYSVYSLDTNAGGTAKDVFYRKLTKGSGAAWTLESAQTVLDGTATIGYHYASIALEGTTRIWLTTGYYDGANHFISVYYSNGLGTAPTWTVSDAALESSSANISIIVRFGSKIGILYREAVKLGVWWKFRSDSDSLTSWSQESQIGTSGINVNVTSGSAIGDTSGNILFSFNSGTTEQFFYYNGTTWTTSLNVVSTTVGSSAFSAISSDGHNAWVFYGDTTGLSSGLSGSRKLVYKKCAPPYTSANCDSSATAVVDYHGVFDKVWTFISSAYSDATTPAGDTTSADVTMPAASADIIYFGKLQKFDAITWDVSTVSTGGAVTWEYWNGSTWSTLTFTASSNTTFQGDGWGSFTDPADWATTTVNSEGTSYYYVRARLTSNFTQTPVGVQMAAIPQINWASATAIPDGTGKVFLTWTENASSVMKVRSTSVTVTTSTQNTASTAEISPVVPAYSSTTGATAPSTMSHIVRTSDGSLHAFVQAGTNLACGNSTSSNNNVGLNWLYSTDSGATWTCGGNLSTDSTTNPMHASAAVDSSDNIYVVYSTAANNGTAKDAYYRKLTKGSGAIWSLGSEQTVLDSTSASTAYQFATIQLEGSTRIWLAARYFDGTSNNLQVYYSDGFGSAPTWTFSATVNISGTGGTDIPAFVRFGSKLGLIYRDVTSVGVWWSYRSDGDGLTSWSAEANIMSDNDNGQVISAVGDSLGNIYLTFNSGTAVDFSFYNGSAWSTKATISSAAANAAFSSVSTDGTNVWVFYGETTGLHGTLTGNRKLVFKKGVPPFAAANFDTNSTAIVSQHGIFDKVWKFASSSYTDETTGAGNITNGDFGGVSSVGDIEYFGKTTKFDTVSWNLSTGGVGGQLVWEYWNGSTWASLTDFIAATSPNFNGASGNSAGYIAFIPNTDWATTTVNSEGTSYYYIRARVITAFSTTPFGTQATTIPAINWASALPNTVSGTTIPLIWTENAVASTRVRYTGISYNSSPSDPTSLGPASLISGGWITSNQPAPTFTLADGDGGATVQYQIQIDNSSDFSSPVVDYTSALGTTGSKTFTVGQAAGTGTYTTGSSGQTLSDGSYYWRVRAIDNFGAVSSYSTANSGAIAFGVDVTAPTTPGTPSTTSPSSTSTPTWTWTASTDATSGVASYTVQWSTDSTFSAGVASGTSATNSFTHSTALADGTWYFRVQAVDTATNTSSYSSNGTVVVDATAPTAFELDSPGNNDYINNERPTFRWKASSDAIGLSKYVLEVDNGDPSASSGQAAGDFSIDNIPTSGTTDVETSKYIIHFDNFADADATNNYISVRTKSSSDWSSDSNSGQNDGKLKEGKRNWKVRAIDSAGNEVSASRNLFVDRTSPDLGINQINNVPFNSNSFATTDKTPTLYGIITDRISSADGSTETQSENGPKIASGPRNVEIRIERLVGLVYQLHTVFTISMDKSYYTCDHREVSDNTQNKCDKYVPFEFTSPNTLDLGTYRVTVAGRDNADNPSAGSGQVFTLRVTTLAQMTTPAEQEIIREGIEVLSPEDQEQVQQQLELTKPAEQLPQESFLQRLQNNIAQILTNIVNSFNQAVNSSLAFIGRQIQTGIAFVGRQIGQGLAYLKFTNQVMAMLLRGIGNGIGSGLAYIWQGLTNAGNAIAFVNQSLLASIGEAINNLGNAFGDRYNQLANNAPGVAKTILTMIGNGVSAAFTTTARLAQNIASALASASNNIGIFTTGIATAITDIWQKTGSMIAVVGQNVAKGINGSISSLAFGVGEKAQDYSEQAGFALVRIGYLFVNEPTKIIDVQVSNLSPTSAKISWTTNHPANGKVNYGLDETYSQDVQSEKRITHHEFTLTNLEPDTQYFFEVMSHNKNYVYDANRKFTTPALE